MKLARTQNPGFITKRTFLSGHNLQLQVVKPREFKYTHTREETKDQIPEGVETKTNQILNICPTFPLRGLTLIGA